MYIEIKNINKSFGKTKILENICLNAESGSCIAILGENGSGKSTLFSVLCGLLKGEGEFLCNGRDLMKEKKLRSKLVGFVPQEPPLIPELTAKDNLMLWYDKKELEKELDCGVLKMLGIHEFYKTEVRKMSGGMKKRLAIGCAVSHKPHILLLDEPTSALDLLCKEKIAQYLADFKKGGGITVLSTHDIGELDACDEIYILKNSRLFAYDKIRDTKSLIGCLKNE
ncbi:MAG: ABC transporter ATP-binding protein [Clostridia bacterium]|nr:ABC transporter ATP-binding protein [Clostridia bacterium]